MGSRPRVPVDSRRHANPELHLGVLVTVQNINTHSNLLSIHAPAHHGLARSGTLFLNPLPQATADRPKSNQIFAKERRLGLAMKGAVGVNYRRFTGLGRRPNTGRAPPTTIRFAERCSSVRARPASCEEARRIGRAACWGRLGGNAGGPWRRVTQVWHHASHAWVGDNLTPRVNHRRSQTRSTTPMVHSRGFRNDFVSGSGFRGMEVKEL